MKSISSNLFYECDLLENVEMSNTVEKIGDTAFYKCISLKSIELSSSLKKISWEAFHRCSSLQSIEIPQSTEIIDSQAFYVCSSLRSVVIPNSVKWVGAMAFDDTAFVNNTANYKNGLLYSGNVLVKADRSFSSFSIEPSTVLICGSAFSNCELLTDIVIPEGITTIHESLFCYCNALKNVSLPSTLKEIDSSAFYLCKSLENITIPNGVETIEHYAFSNCISLKSVVIPNSVTLIDYDAFSNCTSLESVTLSDNMIDICAETFTNCYSLKAITIPKNILYVDYNSFMDCISLKTIKVTGATSVGELLESTKTIEKIYLSPNVTNYNNFFMDYNKYYKTDKPFTVYTKKNSEVYKSCKTYGIDVVTSDVNNDFELTVEDTAIVSKILTGDKKASEELNCDANGDGYITLTDAVTVTRSVAGWEGY